MAYDFDIMGETVYSPKTRGMMERSIGEDKWQYAQYGAFMNEPVGMNRLVFDCEIGDFYYQYVISRVKNGLKRTTFTYKKDEPRRVW